MSKDYSKGRYNAYGYGTGAALIGRIDNDEYVRSTTDTWLFRIDGNEVYSPDGSLAGFIDGGIAASPQNKFLFRLEEE